MKDLALRLESVTGGYGDTTVLRDVSLEVPRGSVSDRRSHGWRPQDSVDSSPAALRGTSFRDTELMQKRWSVGVP